MNTIFSQIDNLNFASDARREGVAVDFTANPSNKAAEQNLITGGGATLADFVVALAQDMVYPFAHASRNQTQGRRFQLMKILHSLTLNG